MKRFVQVMVEETSLKCQKTKNVDQILILLVFLSMACFDTGVANEFLNTITTTHSVASN